MKIRNGFVSNSSNSSFIIVAVKIKDDVFKNYIYDFETGINKDNIEENFLKDFGIHITDSDDYDEDDEEGFKLLFWRGTSNTEFGFIGLNIGDIEENSNKEVTKSQIDEMYSFVNNKMKKLKQITDDPEAKLYGLVNRC